MMGAPMEAVVIERSFASRSNPPHHGNSKKPSDLGFDFFLFR
jgi:hypothetical protein